MRSGALPGVEILLARTTAPLERFYTERYAVCLCEADGPRSSTHREPACPAWLLQPGEVGVRKSGCNCRSLRMLLLDRERVLPAAASAGFAREPRFRTSLAVDADLRRAIDDLCTSMETGAPSSEQQARLANCLRRLLGKMTERAADASRCHPAVARAREYLRRHFNDVVTLEELAGIARMSRFHLLRLFAREVGLPPHAFQMRVRVERAMSLLRSGVPPSGVAGLTGFADQSHLTRVFRRLLQVTPAEYVRSTADG